VCYSLISSLLRYLCLLLAFILLPAISWSKSLILEGDSYQVDQENQRYTYIHPRVTIDKTSILANRLVYDRKANTLSFSGNIIYREDKLLLTADEGVYYPETSEMQLKGATLYDEKSQIYVEASSIRKISEGKFIITDASFTVCKPEAPAWEFKASEIVYELNNFAYAYNATIYFQSLPIFHMPLLSWPTKTGRASGFLFPDFESQSGDSDKSKNFGNRLKIPYFLEFDQEHDLTVTADLMSSRGLGIGLDYNYAFTEGMAGRMNLWFLDEAVENRDLQYENLGNISAAEADLQPIRYQYTLDHRQNIFWGGQFFFQQKNNSDNEINKEFFNSTVDKDISLSRSASFIFPWKDGGLTVQASTQEDFTVASVYDKSTDKDTHLNILPKVSASHRFNRLGDTPLSLDLSGSATNYQRNEGWQGKLYTGASKVSAPFHLDFLNILPSYQRIYYSYDVVYNRASGEAAVSGFDESPSPFGWSIDTKQLEFNFEFFKLFRNQEEEAVGKLSFRPRLIYEEVEDVDQRQALARTPANFALSNGDGDYSFSGHAGTYGSLFINPVMARKSLTFRWETLYLTKDPETKQVQKYLQLNLTQIFDLYQLNEDQTFQGPQNEESFQETKSGDPKLPLRLELILSPTPNFSANLFYRFDYQQKKVVETRLGVSTKSPIGETFAISYTNNSKQYHELNGTNHGAAKTFTVSNFLKLGNKVNLAMSGTWDLNRLNMDTQYAADSSTQYLDRQLTEANLTLTFLQDCYRYLVAYQEEVKTQRVNGNTEEYVDRRITFTFNLVGWPSSNNPYQTFLNF